MRAAGLPALAALLLAGCVAFPSYRDQSVPITSMAVFDPTRYAGLWYEIARFPVPFQEGCSRTQAEYAVAGEGTLSVRNSCMKNGALDVIDGAARVVGPGRLKVELGALPFAADYWVLWVDGDYRTAVVGVPSGRAGWILNRDPDISPDRLTAAREVLEFNGYVTGQLIYTEQGDG